MESPLLHILTLILSQGILLSESMLQLDFFSHLIIKMIELIKIETHTHILKYQVIKLQITKYS